MCGKQVTIKSACILDLSITSYPKPMTSGEKEEFINAATRGGVHLKT
jgi:hypothetical protein